MAKHIKKGIVVTVFALILVSATMSTLPMPAKAELPTVRLGFLTCPDSFYAWLPELKGWDEELGVKYELVKMDTGPQVINLLLSGDIDLGQLGTPPVITSNNRPETTAPVVSINVQVTKVHEFYAAPGSTGTEFTDFVGKKVGYPFGTTMDMMFRLICQDFGLDADNDFEIVNLSPPDAMSSLLTGEIDVAGVWFPWGAMLADEGAPLIYNAGDICDPTEWPKAHAFCPIFALTVSSPAFMEEHPELISQYIALTLRAQEYAKDNLQEVAEISTEYLQGLGAVYSVDSFKYPFATNKFIPYTTVDAMLGAFDEAVDVFEAQSQAWADMGSIDADFRDPAEYIDPTFAEDLKDLKSKATTSIQNAKSDINDAKADGKDVPESEALLDKAETAFDGKDYLQAYTYAEQAIDKVAEETKPLISSTMLAVIGVVVIAAVIVIYYFLRRR